MAHRPSPALEHWQGARREAIDVVALAHARVTAVPGAGRSVDVGRPVAHGYVLQVCAQFQGFVRDLHDLATTAVVSAAQAPAGVTSLLTLATMHGRALDRGNASVANMQRDFSRLGISMNSALTRLQPRWSRASNGLGGDRTAIGRLLELRNCLAHGNEQELRALRQRGPKDTITWARSTLPALNRTARTMDRIVWEHLVDVIGSDPWGQP